MALQISSPRVACAGPTTRPIRTQLLLAAVALLFLATATTASGFDGFIENQGQMDSEVAFYALSRTGAVFLTSDGIVLDLKEVTATRGTARDRLTFLDGSRITRGGATSEIDRGVVVKLTFAGKLPLASFGSGSELPQRWNSFIGNDPGRWRTNLRSYRDVVYHDLWPGIDLRVEQANGEIRLVLDAAAGADVGCVSFLYEGQTAVVRLTPAEDRLETPYGSFLVRLPRDARAVGTLTWIPSKVAGGAVDGIRNVDDRLLGSTYLGGSLADKAFGMAYTPTGIIVVGQTYSAGFPTTPGAYERTHGGYDDAFVAKVDLDCHQLLWGTFLGSYDEDRAHGVDADASGNPVVTGATWASSFPVTPGAFQTDSGGALDVFVTKLSANGDALLWSTYLGGYDLDEPWNVELDGAGNPIVFGGTESENFPVTSGAYDTTYNEEQDTFVTKLNAAGTALVWSTYLGGSSSEVAVRIDIDPSGFVTIAGASASSDYPTTSGAYDRSYNGGFGDAVISRLNASGSSLVWSTYMGGAGDDWGVDVDLNGIGDPVVIFQTASSGFPTTVGAFDQVHNGGNDIAVAELTANGSSIVWSTFVGGAGHDSGVRVVIGPSDTPLLAGNTESAGFPMRGQPYDDTLGGAVDCVLARLAADGSDLTWSTFVGGNGSDWPRDMDLVNPYLPYLIGGTTSTDFPVTPDAYDPSSNGDWDAFVFNLDTRNWTTLHVPADHPTIVDGLAQALYGDTVEIACGVYFEHGLVLKSGVVLRSESGEPDCVTINAQQLGVVFSANGVQGPAQLEGITFTGGTGAWGGNGTVGNSSSLGIRKCVFHGGAANSGGGLYVGNSPVTIEDCTFVQNTALHVGGGLYIGYVAPLVQRCTFYGNSAAYMGGGVYFYSLQEETANIQNCVLTGNSAGGAGAIALAGPARCALSCCDLFGNTPADWVSPGIAEQYGTNGNISEDPLFCDPVAIDFRLRGDSPCAPDAPVNPTCGLVGAWPVGCSEPFTIRLESNGTGDYPTIQAAIDAAEDGYLIELGDGTYSGPGNEDIQFGGKSLTLRSASWDPRRCIIECQTTEKQLHRGFYFAANEGPEAVLHGITIRNGHAERGGAIYCQESSPTIWRCILTSNSATIEGGAVYCEAASPALQWCEITQNYASSGGGISAAGSSAPPIRQTTIADNLGYPGAIWCHDLSSVSLDKSIIAMNVGGTAVDCDPSSTVTLQCSDVYGNPGGDWVGCLAGQETLNQNFSADPLFCGGPPSDTQYMLLSDSPCAAPQQPSCGLVGVWNVGCLPAGVDDFLGVSDVRPISCYPNPLTERARIRYQLTRAEPVSVAIHNAAGQRVRGMVTRRIEDAGVHEVVWDGRDDAGRRVSPGVYYISLERQASRASRAVVVLR